MAGMGQALYRMFFWSYERGSWQYDVAVILILVFVFTPKNWFHDQPQVGLPVNSTQVELLSKSGENEVYKVDARVLAPPARTPELQNDLHNALQRRALACRMAALPSEKSKLCATNTATSSPTRWKSSTSNG